MQNIVHEVEKSEKFYSGDPPQIKNPEHSAKGHANPSCTMLEFWSKTHLDSHRSSAQTQLGNFAASYRICKYYQIWVGISIRITGTIWYFSAHVQTWFEVPVQHPYGSCRTATGRFSSPVPAKKVPVPRVQNRYLQNTSVRAVSDQPKANSSNK